ncbi:MAG TPA: class I SAM-dependent methyltransferase [Thermoanaerobaculia bacterium]|nr:class I SAM-dependent methyltransferase [Thermoanaerobaculia bacterium]
MRCPACGGERFAAKVVAGLTIRRCATCGLRMRPAERREGTGYADVDRDAYQHAIGSVRRAQGEEIVRFVREHVPGGEWLDVGCGFGYLLEAARAAGFQARGIEPDPVAAAAAHAEQGLLDGSTPPADVLSTLDVIEHLDDLDGFAELVKRKTRAVWVVKVPSSDGLFFRIAHTFRLRGAVGRLWQSGYENPHTVYFDEATLTRFVRKHGFSVLAVRYLDEVPTATVVDRLTLAGGMPRWKARLAVPVFAAINLVERLRSKSDALVILASPA